MILITKLWIAAAFTAVAIFGSIVYHAYLKRVAKMQNKVIITGGKK